MVHKTNMQGIRDSYIKMYNVLMELNNVHNKNDCLMGVMISLGDAPFHGWHGKPLENEWETYKQIKCKYDELINMLAIAIGTKE